VAKVVSPQAGNTSSAGQQVAMDPRTPLLCTCPQPSRPNGLCVLCTAHMAHRKPAEKAAAARAAAAKAAAAGPSSSKAARA
jgi:hypothetical protein